jgi:hypothetical protein
METITISQITKSLRNLPSEKLEEVYDFIVFLSERLNLPSTLHETEELYITDTMLASEDVLRRDWDSPEEDEAWAHL